MDGASDRGRGAGREARGSARGDSERRADAVRRYRRRGAPGLDRRDAAPHRRPGGRRHLTPARICLDEATVGTMMKQLWERRLIRYRFTMWKGIVSWPTSTFGFWR